MASRGRQAAAATSAAGLQRLALSY